jgi:phenylalanyl-tRNA synthetase beta chain
MPPFAGFGSGLPFEREEQELRHLISTGGYSETYGLSFSSESVEQKFRPDVEPVRLLNPMSEDWTILRTSLVPSLLKALQWNLHHGTRDLQLFELGKVYRQGAESRTLVLVATGAAQQKTVHTAERDYDFFDIKGDVESILTAFDIDPVTSRDPLPHYYHPGRAARIGDYAIFGELHPDYSDFIKPRQRVYAAELDVEEILRARVTGQAVAPPRYPAIRRDLSLLVERTVTYSMIQDVVRNAGIAELVRIEPFDRLEMGPFPESKYSISVSLTYQSGARTLTDDEVDGFDRKIVELLAKRVGAQLRN